MTALQERQRTVDTDGREAFRIYVAGRSSALLRTAYLLTGNRADAEDLTEAETANVLDVSVGTVKSTTARALAKLRDDAGLRDDPRTEFPAYGAKP